MAGEERFDKQAEIARDQVNRVPYRSRQLFMHFVMAGNGRDELHSIDDNSADK